MRFRRVAIAICLASLNSCALIAGMTPHPITIYSLDGEVLKGEYSFTGRMKGAVTVTRAQDGERFEGNFTSVDDRTFSTSYGQVFGGTHGMAFAPGTNVFSSAYGSATGNSWTRTTAGRFHGMGVLTGKDTVMQCFYMGSMRTNNGIGKCKSNHGKEYDLQF